MLSILLLQGGFAKCYELTDMDTKAIWAGKIVPKSLLVKQHQKDKVSANYLDIRLVTEIVCHNDWVLIVNNAFWLND